MHITILVPGFGLPSPVIGAYEVFTNAGVLWNTLRGEQVAAPFRVVTASVDGKPVSYDGGVVIRPDLLVSCVEALRSGASLLLDGRQATTHWALADEYRQRYPDVDWKPELFITRSDNIFCGGGVYAALDLCLHLVEHLAGYEVARQTGRALLIDSPRTWQSVFSVPALNQRHSDDKILRAQDYLHEYFNAEFTIDELAQRIGMSTRNFTRRFKEATGETPVSYLHQLRINCAKHLLETDYKSVQEVCHEVGYEDIPFFRNIFKRYTGLSPREYRQRYAASSLHS